MKIKQGKCFLAQNIRHSIPLERVGARFRVPSFDRMSENFQIRLEYRSHEKIVRDYWDVSIMRIYFK